MLKTIVGAAARDDNEELLRVIPQPDQAAELAVDLADALLRRLERPPASERPY
jgi:hypothetical protein